MHAENGRHGQELGHEVAVGDRVQAVLADAREPEQPGDVRPVDGQGRAGQSAGPERQHVHPLAALGQAFGVAAEHGVVGQQVVGEQHGLGTLQMGVARQDERAMPFGEPGEPLLQTREQLAERPDFVAQKEPHVQQHLVVAAAGGVQLAADRADLFGQPALDGHVDVLVRGQKGKVSAGELALDGLQALENLFAFGAGDDLLFDQHPAVGAAAPHVVRRQTPVHRQRGSERLHARVGRGREPTGPGFRRFRLHRSDREGVVAPNGAAGGNPERAGNVRGRAYGPVRRRARARIRNRNEFKRMNPSASAWR